MWRETLTLLILCRTAFPSFHLKVCCTLPGYGRPTLKFILAEVCMASRLHPSWV